MSDSKHLFRILLRNCIYTYRVEHKLSQERMAEILHISPRSYSDQEHERYGFSALSLAYYLMQLDDEEILLFFKELRELLNENGEEL